MVGLAARQRDPVRSFSRGMLQRLTIARALLSDPPILILDDALSMVDTRTEERILSQVLEFRKEKTNLIVSHRLSTISRADFIAVLDRGKLVEVGDHETLMATGNEFVTVKVTSPRALISSQTG